ncbi:MAG: hypothetical protein SGPRY_008134, partial [Prymnesium sp.]
MRLFSVCLDAVVDFSAMYELYDPCTLICFHRSRPVPLDVGFGPMRSLAFPLQVKSTLTQILASAITTALGPEAPPEARALARDEEEGEWMGAALE